MPSGVQELIRSSYARFDQRQADEDLLSLDFWHPEGVFVNSADDPDPGVHSGIEAVRSQARRWVEAYPDLKIEPLEIQATSDRAFVWVRFSGHGAGSGIPMHMELANDQRIPSSL